MPILGLGTACPEQRYTKDDCWKAIATSPWFEKLDRRARMIAEGVLLRDNGIAARRLSVDSLQAVFAIDPDTLHARFLACAPALAIAATRRTLADAALLPTDIDGVIISTCTGLGAKVHRVV